MKLATLSDESCRDGRLVVVSKDLVSAVDARAVAPTLQRAIETWEASAPELKRLYDELNQGLRDDAFAFDPRQALAPLPRAYQWCDGSTFLAHGERMQRAFGLAPIEGVDSIPLMYQGASDDFLGPCQPVPLPSQEHGIDFEGEFAVLLDDVPMGCTAEQAGSHIKLLVQLNDISLRNLAPREMKTGFGFIQAKPACSFAPVALTPEELGDAWQAGRVHLFLEVRVNDQPFGRPHGAEMHFSFPELIAHAALTRRLGAGTLVGSGTVSNHDSCTGTSCISERRALEMISTGQAQTPFLSFGDRVYMQATGPIEEPLFGAINHQIVAVHR